jgi:hypothetical protein
LGRSTRKKARPLARPSARRSTEARRSRPRAAPAKQRARHATVARKRSSSQGARANQRRTLHQKQRERERLQKQKERERLQKERERLQKQKERERLQKQRERLQKQKERERLQKQRERERLRKQKERERLQEQKHKEREREALRVQRERQAAARQAQREEAIRARELRREQQRQQREAQRLELQRLRDAERARKEAEREEARRKKEEERSRKEAEREAYRRAKEAERERVRAAREAARRALEGRIARATRQANKGGSRGSTARVYNPGAIPDQSGTTRRTADPDAMRRPVVAPSPAPPVAEQAVAPASAAAPVAETPRPPAAPERVAPIEIDQRYLLIEERLKRAPDDFQREYRESLDMSWIYHDSALEGVVYTFQELKTAIDPSITVVPDSSLQPVCEEIRRHKAAIELVRELGEKRRIPLTVDVIKRLYLTLHPEEGDLKTVKYRRDIPQHRLYFHEYAAPDKIPHKIRQVVDWVNGPEARKVKDPIRIAARAHYDLLRVFPFPTDSGKVSRLLLNLLLLRSGYPPAIIHSTERQRYYDALRGSLQTINAMVLEAVSNGLQSIEKRLDDLEARLHSSSPGSTPGSDAPA